MSFGPQSVVSVSRPVGWIGLGLIALYTGLISAADGITKLIASAYAAPQLFAISGLLVAVISGVCAGVARDGALATQARGAMAARAVLTVLATIAFFQAFRLLPFADVFVFIGLMPIFAGLMSGPVLGEHVRPAAWLALVTGFVGMLCLLPSGPAAAGAGHLWAFAAAVTGTASMVLARLIARSGTASLAQVFWPNLALGLVMAAALPFVWKPMTAADLGLVLAYAVLLFAARFLLVIALRMMAAYVVVPLLNLQFIWMIAIGMIFFSEVPQAATILGAAIVIASGVFMVWDRSLTPAGTLDPLPTDPQTEA